MASNDFPKFSVTDDNEPRLMHHGKEVANFITTDLDRPLALVDADVLGRLVNHLTGANASRIKEAIIEKMKSPNIKTTDDLAKLMEDELVFLRTVGAIQHHQAMEGTHPAQTQAQMEQVLHNDN